MGWLRVLPDPTSVLMNLRVVRDMVYQMECHRLCGGGHEDTPE